MAIVMLLFFSGLRYRFCTREGSTGHNFCGNFFCGEDSKSCLSSVNIIEFSHQELPRLSFVS